VGKPKVFPKDCEKLGEKKDKKKGQANFLFILVVLKISLFPSAPKEEPAFFPEKEPETAAAPEDKTKAAEEDATVMEGEIAGTLTVIVKGEEIGTFDIHTAPMNVGRDPRSDIVIKSETVSKNHLKIISKGDQFFIVDLRSTNGTYVNGEKITETLVTPDDMVQLGKRGNIKLIFKK
jgi:pSer/pThr/pTyr-binding forkhead associated (FHA) protein